MINGKTSLGKISMCPSGSVFSFMNQSVEKGGKNYRTLKKLKINDCECE